MHTILARSRWGAELPPPKQTGRDVASALGRLLHTALERLIFRQDEVPPEFFRYPRPE